MGKRLEEIERKLDLESILLKDARYLLSEVHRLREAIEKHRKDVREYLDGTTEGYSTTEWEDFDIELYKALGEEE